MSEIAGDVAGMDFLLRQNVIFCKEIDVLDRERQPSVQGALMHTVCCCDKKIQQMHFIFFV